MAGFLIHQEVTIHQRAVREDLVKDPSYEPFFSRLRTLSLRSGYTHLGSQRSLDLLNFADFVTFG